MSRLRNRSHHSVLIIGTGIAGLTTAYALCKACEKFCPTGAIDFNQEDEILTFQVGNIILATGYDLFDARRIPQYGYGRLANVFTSLEFERLTNAAGPTSGKVTLADGSKPKSVAVVHCVGSRDANTNEYCSRACCIYSLKLSQLVHEYVGAEVHEIYRDMRASARATKSSTTALRRWA